ncbi:unnamed protein product [Prorocentrum cordatum]|uniref:Uncharacterized protein n=1 Tax=Prorocentrum cordatum TaxID=2364126 RepID=A0ABN9R8X1_9DINO|nr:unnamed protein product [Polarella glacialis]
MVGIVLAIIGQLADSPPKVHSEFDIKGYVDSTTAHVLAAIVPRELRRAGNHSAHISPIAVKTSAVQSHCVGARCNDNAKQIEAHDQRIDHFEKQRALFTNEKSPVDALSSQGMPTIAARRVNAPIGALKIANREWGRIVVEDAQDLPEDLHVAEDKNPSQIRKELALMWARKAIQVNREPLVIRRPLSFPIKFEESSRQIAKPAGPEEFLALATSSTHPCTRQSAHEPGLRCRGFPRRSFEPGFEGGPVDVNVDGPWHMSFAGAPQGRPVPRAFSNLDGVWIQKKVGAAVAESAAALDLLLLAAWQIFLCLALNQSYTRPSDRSRVRRLPQWTWCSTPVGRETLGNCLPLALRRGAQCLAPSATSMVSGSRWRWKIKLKSRLVVRRRRPGQLGSKGHSHGIVRECSDNLGVCISQIAAFEMRAARERPVKGRAARECRPVRVDWARLPAGMGGVRARGAAEVSRREIRQKFIKTEVHPLMEELAVDYYAAAPPPEDIVKHLIQSLVRRKSLPEPPSGELDDSALEKAQALVEQLHNLKQEKARLLEELANPQPLEDGKKKRVVR